jgi:hypothetical protein
VQRPPDRGLRRDAEDDEPTDPASPRNRSTLGGDVAGAGAGGGAAMVGVGAGSGAGAGGGGAGGGAGSSSSKRVNAFRSVSAAPWMTSSHEGSDHTLGGLVTPAASV